MPRILYIACVGVEFWSIILFFCNMNSILTCNIYIYLYIYIYIYIYNLLIGMLADFPRIESSDRIPLDKISRTESLSDKISWVWQYSRWFSTLSYVLALVCWSNWWSGERARVETSWWRGNQTGVCMGGWNVGQSERSVGDRTDQRTCGLVGGKRTDRCVDILYHWFKLDIDFVANLPDFAYCCGLVRFCVYVCMSVCISVTFVRTGHILKKFIQEQFHQELSIMLNIRRS